jgi:hypothetical protein
MADHPGCTAGNTVLHPVFQDGAWVQFRAVHNELLLGARWCARFLVPCGAHIVIKAVPRFYTV